MIAQLPEAPAAPNEAPRALRPILVASDGTRETDSALAMAWALAGQTCRDVQVVACATPFDATGELQAMKPAPDERWRARREVLLGAIESQMQRTLPPGGAWPVTVVTGYGGEDIAAFAQTMDARLIVMGRGRHGMLQRLVHGPEEVLRVLQLGDIPVLAVEPGVARIPRRVVIGTDFSPYSTFAARVALQFAAPDAILYLAHVVPGGPLVLHTTAADRAYRAALPAMFAAQRDGLSPSAGQHVETIELTGEPGHALREFAREINADLIVTATHGRGLFDRMIQGSVAVELLRHAPCSFLCVPGTALDRRATSHDEYLGPRSAIRSSALPEALDAFTQRNAGRTCRVELDRPDEGSRILVHDRPFVSASYHAPRGALTVVVGTLVGPTAEHTHILSSIRSVDRLVDGCDHDRGLLVDDGDAGVLRLVFTS